MDRKTVTVLAATGVAGRACVEELSGQDVFDVRVLVRKPGMQEKASSGVPQGDDAKQQQWNAWRDGGVDIRSADVTDCNDLIPALEGTDYLVSCVPLTATESQYPLIWAAREAGVERFVPSEFGAIYEWEQSLPTDTIHRAIARQKVFVRKVTELAGLGYTIIPAGLWPEYYMLEPVGVMGDRTQKVAWSTGRDVGRIIPHVLAHPASRNATCPVAATAYCTWDEFLDARERALGRKVERRYLDAGQWKALYASLPPGPARMLAAIGVAASEQAQGQPLFGHWNATHLPDFEGTPLEERFPGVVEPFVAAMKSALG
jgi:uncharacterized protein YbjT (DUF2867 family)